MIRLLTSALEHLPPPPPMPPVAAPWLAARAVGRDVVSQAWADCFSAGLAAGASLSVLGCLVLTVIVLILALAVRGRR